MFRNKTRLLVIALSVATLGLLAGCRHSPEGRADKIASKITKGLDLNEQQKTELDKLKKDALEDFKTFKSEKIAMMDEIEKQLANSKLEAETLKKLAKEHHAKREAVMDEWIDKITGFYSQLAPDQKDKVLKHLKKFRSHMENHME